MQEQGISLDEVDQDGNSAVHVASQHGYLGCIQVRRLCCFEERNDLSSNETKKIDVLFTGRNMWVKSAFSIIVNNKELSRYSCISRNPHKCWLKES